MAFLKKAAKIFDFVLDALRFLAMILLLFAWLSACFEVFMRYFFNRPQVWTSELVEYSLLYMTFLGTAWVLREEQHVTMDITISKLGPKTRNIANIATSVLSGLLCLVMTWYAGTTTLVHFNRASVTPKALEFPLYPLLGIISLGFGLLTVQFMRRAYKSMKNVVAVT